ncbi:MAG: EAL domain-containing protein, partial [Gammaproteobacteria bacterium]
LRRLDDGMDQWIQLRAQPIHDLHKPDAPPHYEILMAVQDDSGHFVSPATLIEVAERYHRMTDVDKWVFRRVMDWMEQNPEVIQAIHGLSINLSGNTISEPAALDEILNDLTRRRVDRSRVCFEITETAAVRDLGAAVSFIRDVRQLGCKVSLDDFGTGMSSYAYLQELPVDYVKIDGIFIRNLKDNVKDQALVRSIAEMAQLLGMKTIAEYVEDEHTEEFLRLLGVGYGQGYHYGRPAILNELAGQIMARQELEGN